MKAARHSKATPWRAAFATPFNPLCLRYRAGHGNTSADARGAQARYGFQRKHTLDTEMENYYNYPMKPSSCFISGQIRRKQGELHMYCKNCGAEMEAGAAVCMKCGFAARTGNRYCGHCGTSVAFGQAVCVQCGFPLEGAALPNTGYGAKSKVAAGLLGIFLGSLGIHNFYLGYTKRAVAQLLITILGSVLIFPPIIIGIWALVEGIFYLTGREGYTTDAEGNLLGA